jgi:alanine-synthesizing transaminase
MEIYNKDKDENFSKYIDSIIASKMLEVCSTTLPQYLIPEIYENINYKESLVNRIKKYQARAKIAKDIL